LLCILRQTWATSINHEGTPTTRGDWTAVRDGSDQGMPSSSAVSAALWERLNRLLKDSILSLVLGGAAGNRCDKRPIFSAGFSR